MPMPIKTTPAITVVFLGVKVRILELPILNRQLIRANYDTLGDLVKDLISGKITFVTDIHLMIFEDLAYLAVGFVTAFLVLEAEPVYSRRY